MMLAIDRLSLDLVTPRGSAPVLDAVSLDVAPGEIVGLVGESGSGKSVLAMAASRLLPPGSFVQRAGTIALDGRDVQQAVRGRDVAVVFQEPMRALNPALRIERQIGELLRLHHGLDRAAARARAIELLGDMQIADPARVLALHPGALSGGMRQRVLLAMAFACAPRLLIADEPTTALDVTVQAQILALLEEKAHATGTAILFISHDMAVIERLCRRVYVLYAGRVVETGPTAALLRAPRHPYTRALLDSMPARHAPKTELAAIPGRVPSPFELPAGCRFRGRCSFEDARCVEPPPSVPVGEMHHAACWRVAEGVR